MISRRDFVTQAAAITAAGHRSFRGTCSAEAQTPPSDRLNIAGVGVGGMGRTNLLNLGSTTTSSRCATWTGATPAAWDVARAKPI